jgi:hypothetical protein
MKQHTIIKTRKGKDTEYTGSLIELTKSFSYTLLCGNEWNSKINQTPKTIKGLITALNQSVRETQGSSYDPDYYQLKTI